MKIINLTPHEIVLYKNGTVSEKIQSSGFVRANQVNQPNGEINGYPVSIVRFGKVEGMPEAKANTAYVVSQITANALKLEGRTEDILIVDQAVRDSKGKIIGCRGFAKV